MHVLDYALNEKLALYFSLSCCLLDADWIVRAEEATWTMGWKSMAKQQKELSCDKRRTVTAVQMANPDLRNELRS